MERRKEHEFAEKVFEKLDLENLPQEQSAYFEPEGRAARRKLLMRFEPKLRWHLRNSLSRRQSQVMRLILKGKTEREIAAILGITQQVVHIYKQRAIKKLRETITV